MQRSDLRRRLTAAVLSHPRWRVGPTPKRLKLAKGTRVDRRMIEQADDKIRERVDYYLGRMFGGEDVPETMEDLSHVTSQVRETFERLYEDVEDIVEDEELTQAESTELWKVVSKALTDQVYDVIYGTQEVLDPDDYDKLEKAVVKGFDDSDEGPLVDEDDEEERQEALDEYLGNGGKNASDLRRRLVRLAHENPKLRPHLLPLLRNADSAYPDDDMYLEYHTKKEVEPGLVYTKEEAEAVFQVWVDALLSSLGSTASVGPVRSGEYQITTNGPTYFGAECQIEDSRLPGHWKKIDLEWTHYEPDTVKISVNPRLGESKWIHNMVQSMTGLRSFYVEAQGDLASLTRDARPKINELMGTLNPIIMMEGQRRRATKDFGKFSDLLKVKIEDAFQANGFPVAKVWGGITGGEANVTNDGASYSNLSLVVEGLLGSEELVDKMRGREVAAQARKVISLVTTKFTQDGVVAKLSSKPAYWSARTYNTNIMIYFKDGPAPKVKFGSEDVDPLRSRLIRLAHENVTLRPHLLPLLSRTAGTESALLEALLPKVRWYRLMNKLDTHSAGRGDKLYEALQERVRLTSNEDRALGILRNLEAKRDVDSAYLVESARKAADLLGLPPNDTSMAKFDGPLAKLFQPSDWYGFVNKVDRDGARLLNASLAHLESRVAVIFRSNEFRNAFWKLVKYLEGSPASSAQEVFDTIVEAAIALNIPLSRLAASRQVSAAPKTENEKMMDWVNNKIKSYTRMTTTLPSEEDIESTRKKLVNYANMIIKKRQEKVGEYEAALQGFDPEAWSEDMRKYQRETFPTRPVKDPDVNFHVGQLKESLKYFKQAVLNWEALKKMANTRQYGELVTALLKFRAALDLSNSGRNPS